MVSHPVTLTTGGPSGLLCMRAVQKETELFFLIYCCTCKLIRLVSFKVLPSTVDTLLPAFFLVLERVLERVLQDGAKVL
jgi:hypothetical protein